MNKHKMEQKYCKMKTEEYLALPGIITMIKKYFIYRNPRIFVSPFQKIQPVHSTINKFVLYIVFSFDIAFIEINQLLFENM